MRKFEEVKKEFKKYGDEPTKMPIRSTSSAVCYDFFSPVDEVINPNETKLVFTNVKAYFGSDEGLILAVRSSMGLKGVIAANGIGIIESDYADNESNDGNLGFMLFNHGNNPYVIKKGDKIGQGYFFKFLTTDDDNNLNAKRKGGFGSTN